MSALQPNTYAVLTRCIEEGLQAGWNRAHKHSSTPREAHILEQQQAAIMLCICEFFTFTHPYPEHQDENNPSA